MVTKALRFNAPLEDRRNILADKKIKEIEYGSINRNAKSAAKYGGRPPQPSQSFINPIIEDGHPRVLAALAKSYIPLNQEQKDKLDQVGYENNIVRGAMAIRHERDGTSPAPREEAPQEQAAEAGPVAQPEAIPNPEHVAGAALQAGPVQAAVLPEVAHVVERIEEPVQQAAALPPAEPVVEHIQKPVQQEAEPMAQPIAGNPDAHFQPNMFVGGADDAPQAPIADNAAAQQIKDDEEFVRRLLQQEQEEANFQAALQFAFEDGLFA